MINSQEIKIYSPEHDISGTININGDDIDLTFLYEGKQVFITVYRDNTGDTTLEEQGKILIDNYIRHINKANKMELHDWRLVEKNYNGKEYWVASGYVTGHRRLPDHSPLVTEQIYGVSDDSSNLNLLILTEYTIYYCPIVENAYTEDELKSWLSSI